MRHDHPATPTRPPTLSDEEVRRRLGQVYRLLLDLRRKKLTAAAAAGSPTPAAADPTPEPEREA